MGHMKKARSLGRPGFSFHLSLEVVLCMILSRMCLAAMGNRWPELFILLFLSGAAVGT